MTRNLIFTAMLTAFTSAAIAQPATGPRPAPHRAPTSAPSHSPAPSPEDAKKQLAQLPGWRITHDGRRIRKDWKVKNFLAGIQFFNHCADLAEADGHHPDLHIEGYRNVWVELWTHAIGGLSENDFILAAKIDELPIVT